MKTINCSRLHPSKMNKLTSSLLNPIHTYPLITLGIVACGMLTLIAAFLCMCRKSQSFGDEHTLEEFRQAMQSKLEEARAWRDAEISGDGTLYDDTSSAFGSDDCYASLKIKNEIEKTPAQGCGGGGDADYVEVEEKQAVEIEEMQTVEVEEIRYIEIEQSPNLEIEEMKTLEVEDTQVKVEETQGVEVKETD